MNKALEEATFADVYADLCKEYHSRSMKRSWNFIKPVESTLTPNVSFVDWCYRVIIDLVVEFAGILLDRCF